MASRAFTRSARQSQPIFGGWIGGVGNWGEARTELDAVGEGDGVCDPRVEGGEKMGGIIVCCEELAGIEGTGEVEGSGGTAGCDELDGAGGKSGTVTGTDGTVRDMGILVSTFWIVGSAPTEEDGTVPMGGDSVGCNSSGIYKTLLGLTRLPTYPQFFC